MERFDWDYGGIDPSLTNIGLCRYRIGGEFQSTTIGSVGVTNLIAGERIRVLEDLAESAADFMRDCGLVGIEGYAFGTRGRGISAMGELGGLIRRCLNAECLEFVEVSPATLKKWTAEKGNADKTQIALYLYKRFCVEFDNSHEADAYALCRLMECADGQIEPLTKAQKEAITKLKREELKE